MDLYRYFHPHYNPRLRNRALRLVEVGELEQAAVELRKAIERAEVRTANTPESPFSSEHFSEIIRALDYVVDYLSKLMKIHPGDPPDSLLELLSERENAPGWESWSALLRERLDAIRRYDSIPDGKNSAATGGS